MKESGAGNAAMNAQLDGNGASPIGEPGVASNVPDRDLSLDFLE
jgi:hypothetical protein